jgi:hypothetical protein
MNDPTLAYLDSIAREAHAEAVAALTTARGSDAEGNASRHARESANAADRAGKVLLGCLGAVGEDVRDAMTDLVDAREHRRDTLRAMLP